ncbi:hypothetical protein ES703_23795 [subsurface metagenome]
MASCEPNHFSSPDPVKHKIRRAGGKIHTSFQQDFFEIEREKGKREAQLMNLAENLKTCGWPLQTNLKCKKCIAENLEPLIKELKEKEKSCEIRYCPKEKCIEVRYAKTLTALENTKYKIKNGFRTITDNTQGLHLGINYQRCKVENLKKEKRKLDRQKNYFFQKLRKGNPCPKGFRTFRKKVCNEYKNKKGETIKTEKFLPFYKKLCKNGKFKDTFCYDPIPLSGIQVFDLKYYFDTDEFLLHYHFLVFPLGKYIDFNVLQQVRKNMIENSKSKRIWRIDFYLNPKHKYGYKRAKSVMKYLTKRAIGIYGKSDKYDELDLTKKRIRDIVHDKGIYFLSDIMNVNEYYDNFYNAKVVAYFGKELLRQYIYNGAECLTNVFCRFHGKLEPQDILIERIIMFPSVPPPGSSNSQNITGGKENIVAGIIEKLEAARKPFLKLQEIPVTIVTIKPLPTPSKLCSCGLNVVSADWNDKHGVCVYCALQKSYWFKKAYDPKCDQRAKELGISNPHKTIYEEDKTWFILSRLLY